MRHKVKTIWPRVLKYPTPEGAPPPGHPVVVSGRYAEVEGIRVWMDPIRSARVHSYTQGGDAILVTPEGFRAVRAHDLLERGSRIRVREPMTEEETMAKAAKKGTKKTTTKAPKSKAPKPEAAGAGRRAPNKGGRTVFLVEKAKDGGVTVAIQGQEEKTRETIPAAVLEASTMKAAYAYTEKHIGPRAEVGNKGGSLYNRIRLVLGAWTPPAKAKKAS